MKKLLLRLFVKNYTDTRNPAVRTQYGKLAGITGIFCNLLLFAGLRIEWKRTGRIL